MKRLITALILVAMSAGAAMADGNATLQRFAGEAELIATVGSDTLKTFCKSNTAKVILAKYSKEGADKAYQMVSDEFARQAPRPQGSPLYNSRADCRTLNGVVVMNGLVEATVVKGKTVEVIFYRGWLDELIYIFDMAEKTVRMADKEGYSVAFSVMEQRIFSVKIKGANLEEAALSERLNNIFTVMLEPNGANMYQLAYDLLLNDVGRQKILETSKLATNKNAQAESPDSKETPTPAPKKKKGKYANKQQ